eukprot:631522-Amphidinium_carterae.1
MPLPTATAGPVISFSLYWTGGAEATARCFLSKLHRIGKNRQDRPARPFVLWSLFLAIVTR